MKRIITFLFISVLIRGTVHAQLCGSCPTDNPLATFYGDSGDYAFWTDEIMWNVVIDMSTYPNGANDFEKFKNARDYLYDNFTGGVLYYPAGTYTFDIPDIPQGEGLALKKGVVIRGQAPTTDKKAIITEDIENMSGTDNGLNSLPTKFVFTTQTIQGGQVNKMWNQIGCKKGANEANLGEVSHVGIAWVEIRHGYIHFGVDNKRWSATYGTGLGYIGGASKIVDSWEPRVADGTLPLDPFVAMSNGHGKDTAIFGEKRFVFGCKLLNAGMPNTVSNKAAVSGWVTDPYPFAWAGKISVYGKHIFIANNVIAKPTASFQPFSWTCKGGSVSSGTVINHRYDYGYGIGIDVNKSSGACFANRTFMDNPVPSLYYAEDVVIQDNFIYNHGDKSIEAIGKYIVVKHNVMPRDFLAFNDDPYGIGKPSPTYGINWSNGKCWNAESVDDMMSRAMDMGGWCGWFTNNYYRSTGCNYANDGEGILFQRHNGIEVYSIAETYNYGCQCGGNSGYIAPYDIHVVGLFQAWNYQNGAIGIVNTNANWGEDISCPGQINWDFAGITEKTPSGMGGTNIQDFYDSCNTTITPADTVLNLSVVLNVIDYKTEITWTDNSTKEIAYKIQKRKAGTSNPWTTVAYRPRQHTTSANSLWDIRVTFGYAGSPTGADSNVYKASWPKTIMVNDMNPPAWVDYKANPGDIFEYRVVTVGCYSEAATGAIVVDDKSIATSPVRSFKVKVVPNPVTGSAIISYNLPEGQTASVDIMDMNGRVVLNLAHGSYAPSVTLPAGVLKKGTYLVKVMSSGGSGVVDKFIVQ